MVPLADAPLICWCSLHPAAVWLRSESFRCCNWRPPRGPRRSSARRLHFGTTAEMAGTILKDSVADMALRLSGALFFKKHCNQRALYRRRIALGCDRPPSASLGAISGDTSARSRCFVRKTFQGTPKRNPNAIALFFTAASHCSSFSLRIHVSMLSFSTNGERARSFLLFASRSRGFENLIMPISFPAGEPPANR